MTQVGESRELRIDRALRTNHQMLMRLQQATQIQGELIRAYAEVYAALVALIEHDIDDE